MVNLHCITGKVRAMTEIRNREKQKIKFSRWLFEPQNIRDLNCSLFCNFNNCHGSPAVGIEAEKIWEFSTCVLKQHLNLQPFAHEPGD